MKAHLNFSLSKYVGSLKNLKLLSKEDICIYVGYLLPLPFLLLPAQPVLFIYWLHLDIINVLCALMFVIIFK